MMVSGKLLTTNYAAKWAISPKQTRPGLLMRSNWIDAYCDSPRQLNFKQQVAK